MKTPSNYSKFPSIHSKCCHTSLLLFSNDKSLCSLAKDKDPAQNYTFHSSYKLLKTSVSNGNKNNSVMVAGAKWNSTLKIAWLHSPVAWVLHEYDSKIIHLSFLPVVARSQSMLWILRLCRHGCENWSKTTARQPGAPLCLPFSIRSQVSLASSCCRWGKHFDKPMHLFSLW